MRSRAISPRQAIANKCKDCTYDTEAAGSWRQQTATCPVVHCALWAFRPLQGNPPAWLAARDAAQLPNNWRSMPNVEAVAIIAAKAPNSCEGTPFQDNVVSGDRSTPADAAIPVNPPYLTARQGIIK